MLHKEKNNNKIKLKNKSIKTHHEFFVDDHLVDDRVHDRKLELKHVGERDETERVIDGAVGKEIGAQTLLFDLLCHQRLDDGPLVEQVPHLSHKQSSCK